MLYNDILLIMELNDKKSIEELFNILSSVLYGYELISIENENYNIRAYGYIDNKIEEIIVVSISVKGLVGFSHIIMLWWSKPIVASYMGKGEQIIDIMLHRIFNNSLIRIKRLQIFEKPVVRSLLEYVKRSSEGITKINTINKVFKVLFFPIYAYRNIKFLEYISYTLYDVYSSFEHYYGKSRFENLLNELVDTIKSSLQLGLNRTIISTTVYAAMLTILVSLLIYFAPSFSLSNLFDMLNSVHDALIEIIARYLNSFIKLISHLLS